MSEGQIRTPNSDGSERGTVQPSDRTASVDGQPSAPIQVPAPADTNNFTDVSQFNQASPSLSPAFAVGNNYDGGTFPSDANGLPNDITWTAAEFVEHQKSMSWYIILVLAGLAAAVVDFFSTHDFISTGVIVLAAALFGAYAGHKPRTQQYRLSPQGLQIGERLYVFQAFRNFSVTEEAGLASIIFMPLKRFAPALTIYVASDLEEQVLDYLSEFLPFEQHRADAVDGLLRRIRF